LSFSATHQPRGGSRNRRRIWLCSTLLPERRYASRLLTGGPAVIRKRRTFAATSEISSHLRHGTHLAAASSLAIFVESPHVESQMAASVVFEMRHRAAKLRTMIDLVTESFFQKNDYVWVPAARDPDLRTVNADRSILSGMVDL
jgi:hypothetical protein